MLRKQTLISRISIGLSLAALPLLSGCGTAGGEAEKDYDMTMVTHPTIGEVCTSAQKVAAAYQTDKNDAKAQEWKAKAAGLCAQAKAEGNSAPYKAAK